MASTQEHNSDRGYVPPYNEEDFPTYLKMVKAACVNMTTFPLLSTESPINAVEMWLTKYPNDKTALRALQAPNTLMSDALIKERILQDPMQYGPAIISLVTANHIGTQPR